MPFDVHLMISDPDKYINEFVTQQTEFITVHAEACIHLHRTLQSLKQKGYIAVCGLEESVTHPTRKFDTRIEKTEYVARLVESQGLCDSALAQIGLSFLRKPKKGQSEEDRQKLIAELEAMLEEYKNGEDD